MLSLSDVGRRGVFLGDYIDDKGTGSVYSDPRVTGRYRVSYEDMTEGLDHG